MPKPDGTMTFEEYMDDLAETIEFDEGDTPEVLLELGKKVHEKELRKREERLRAKRLKPYFKKKAIAKKMNPELYVLYVFEEVTGCEH